MKKPRNFWRNLSAIFFYDEPPKLSETWGGRIIQALFVLAILWAVFVRLREMLQG